MKVLWVMVFAVALVGCSTYAELGQGHVARTLVSEERSAFGTNMGFSKLQHCEKNTAGELVHCHDLTGWQPMWSQGVGGQIMSGALIGIGAGLGGALSGSSAASSSVSNVTTVAPHGGHK